MAFYHANYKFATVLLLLIVGFRNAWQPFFLKIAEEKDAKKTYSRIFSYYLFLAGGIAIFMTFFVKNILTYRFFDAFYLLGSQYWQGIEVIPWIVLSYFFFGVYVIFTPAFYITKKSKYMILFTGSGALLNILTNIILLPHIGIWGAVTATVIAYFAMAISIFVISQQIYPISIDYSRIIPILLVVGLAYLIYYILDLSLIFRITIFIAIGIGGFLFLFRGEIFMLKKLLTGKS